jgi:predicted phage tail protein
VAGYLVLRGTAADVLAVITPMPITETTFVDGVAAGTRYWYEVRAVDRAGNISPVSNRVEELAR